MKKNRLKEIKELVVLIIIAFTVKTCLIEIYVVPTGSMEKTILIGDSEVDSEAAQNASIPFLLVENGYTSKNKNQIKHDHVIKNFIGLEKLIGKYIND